MTEESPLNKIGSPEWNRMMDVRIQAMNMARSLLTPAERQCMDNYYDALTNQVDIRSAKGLEDLERRIDEVEKPLNFDEVEDKYANLVDVILQSGLAKKIKPVNDSK